MCRRNSNRAVIVIDIQICEVNGVDDEMWRKSVERRIDLLQKENQELKKTLENIGLENKQLKDDLDLVKKRCVSCDSLDTSEDDITGEKVEMSFIQDMGKVETDSDSEMVNRRDKEPVARIIPPASSIPVSAVAFYSYMSTNTAASLPTHHTLIYDVVQITEGMATTKTMEFSSLLYPGYMSFIFRYASDIMVGPVLKSS
ncbi:uncharacterized protein LOC125683754 isoform X1 [Ostrea edulis]|uniref:uncharacterized protein LOC125683754 isoform X1 n=1 Tax=Ostrea edulis TaxID=37623 RepID=UPI0024AF25B8|nr:uncharacterized protein LOC125683754 isoform X1 [Ostrea edulis]